jgi:hypothetical protein
MLQFEVHSEDDEGKPLLTEKGEPMSISKNFTNSYSENATLRKDLENWQSGIFAGDGLRTFHIKNVLGKWAMLSVGRDIGQDGNEYTNIKSINPLSPQIKKAGLPDPYNEAKIFDLDDPDMELFETFSNKLKEKNQNSPEWAQRKVNRAAPKKQPESGFDDMDNDIPF